MLSATYQRMQAVPLNRANSICLVVIAFATQKPISITHPTKKLIITTFSFLNHLKLKKGISAFSNQQLTNASPIISIYRPRKSRWQAWRDR